MTPPRTPYAYAGMPGPLPTGIAPREKAPDAEAPRWSARKTAVTAGLSIVLASAGAIGAAAAMPAGTTVGDTGGRGGAGRTFQFPGGQQNQNGQQLPNQQNQNGGQLPNLQNGAPGGGLNGIDPFASTGGAKTT